MLVRTEKVLWLIVSGYNRGSVKPQLTCQVIFNWVAVIFHMLFVFFNQFESFDFFVSNVDCFQQHFEWPDP